LSVTEKKAEMVNYEGMFLLDSGKFAADHEGTIGHVIEILEKAGAEIVAHRPWQDGKLAYEIDGHMKGLHYLVYFRMPVSGMDSITRACHLSDIVIRQMVIKQPQTLFDAMVSAIDPAAAPESTDEDSSGSENLEDADYDAIDDGDDDD